MIYIIIFIFWLLKFEFDCSPVKAGPTQTPPVDKMYCINLSLKSLQVLVRCGGGESFIFHITLRRQAVVPLIRIDMQFYVTSIEIILTYFTKMLVDGLLSALTFTTELLQLCQNYMKTENEGNNSNYNF
jgi:hypothetical protein